MCLASIVCVSACGSEEDARTNAGAGSGTSPDDDDDDDGASSGQPSDRDASAPIRDAGSVRPHDAGRPDAAPIGPGSSCTEPFDVGALSGDLESQRLAVTGTCGVWITLRAIENATGVDGVGMRVRFTLISPPAQNFDLEVFYDPLADVPECSASQGRSAEPASRSDVVDTAWGEGFFPNNVDDSRTLVAHVVGPCADNSWSMLVEGNL